MSREMRQLRTTSGVLLLSVLCVCAEDAKQTDTVAADNKRNPHLNVELPYLNGESKMVYNPEPSGANGRWFINDHCFIEGTNGVLHFFGINNPYPPKGKELYRYHPYIGHATSVDPEKGWRNEGFALDDSRGAEYLGAPFVVRLHRQQRYIMLFESMIGGRRTMELAYSADLFRWQRTHTPVLQNLPETKRDPCIVEQGDGSFLIFLCTPNPSGSSVTVTKTSDFESFEPPKTCLLIRDGITYGGIESPFVVKRNGLYYLFFTYAHRHYYETVVCCSDTYEHFTMDDVVTTLYGHAAEIFDFNGKTFISSCGPEDDQSLNRHGLYLARFSWGGL